MSWNIITPSGNSHTISGLANSRVHIRYLGIKASAAADLRIEYSTDNGANFSAPVTLGVAGSVGANQPCYGWTKLDGIDGGHVAGEHMTMINQSTVTAPQTTSNTTRVLHAFDAGAAITDVRISLGGGATFAAGDLAIDVQ